MGISLKVFFAFIILLGGYAAQAQVLGKKEAFTISYAPIFIALIASLFVAVLAVIAIKYCMSGKKEFSKLFSDSKVFGRGARRIAIVEVRKMTSSSAVGLVQLDGVEYFVFLNDSASPKLLPAKGLGDWPDEGKGERL